MNRIDLYSLSGDESSSEGCFQASASVQKFTVTKEGNVYQFPKKSFLDRMKESDPKQTRIRFYPKAKAKRNNSYSRDGVCDVSNNDAKDEQNKVTKKKHFGDATKSKLKENQNIPDSSVCDKTDNSTTNVKVVKQDRLDNGYLVEKEVHGDKIVNYHLDNGGNRILLPGFVYTTKNYLCEDTRSKSYKYDHEKNLPLPEKKGCAKKGEEPSASQEESSKGKRKPDLASEDNSRNGEKVKASASAKVGEKRKAEELQEEYESFLTKETRKSKSKFSSGKVQKKKRRAKASQRKPFISKYLGRMTCIECGQEVTAVVNMEESSEFKCDDCWMDYDHGCDVDRDCEECRELAIGLQVRFDVLRRISEGELDGSGTNEKSVPTDDLEGELVDDGINEKKSATTGESDGELNDKSVRIDGLEGELYNDGTNEKSAIIDGLEEEFYDGGTTGKPALILESDGDDGDSFKSNKDCLICTECGAATEVPVVVEDSSRFNCDDCLLSYQHGCDLSQHCQQCRDIVVWVQARRAVVRKLKGDLLDEEQIVQVETEDGITTDENDSLQGVHGFDDVPGSLRRPAVVAGTATMAETAHRSSRITCGHRSKSNSPSESRQI